LTVAAYLNAPHTGHTEQDVVNGLGIAGQLTASLVAVADGDLIGHVASSPVSISDDAVRWFGPGPVSVLPQCQRQGVGSRLLREALGRWRARSPGGRVVLGEPECYGRFGFKAEPGLALPGIPAQFINPCHSATRGRMASSPITRPSRRAAEARARS
jgi:putative acetyltransferase